MPLDNAVSREMEAEADWIALETTRDPAAARALFRGFTREALQDPTPPGWAYQALETHPSIAERIAMATAWERRHAGQELRSRSALPSGFNRGSVPLPGRPARATGHPRRRR
jgi:predicted Zn-dependent protease